MTFFCEYSGKDNYSNQTSPEVSRWKKPCKETRSLRYKERLRWLRCVKARNGLLAFDLTINRLRTSTMNTGLNLWHNCWTYKLIGVNDTTRFGSNVKNKLNCKGELELQYLINVVSILGKILILQKEIKQIYRS